MKLYINGMMCQHCAARVQKALEAAGCKAEINLEGKYALLPDDLPVDEAVLREAVQKAGYEPVKLEKE